MEPSNQQIYFVYKITIVLLVGVAAAAPGLYLAGSPAATIGTRIAPFAYAPAPITYSQTYAQPATITKFESASSPLTYTASHQPAVSLTNIAQVPLTYSAYPVIYQS